MEPEIKISEEEENLSMPKEPRKEEEIKQEEDEIKPEEEEIMQTNFPSRTSCRKRRRFKQEEEEEEEEDSNINTEPPSPGTSPSKGSSEVIMNPLGAYTQSHVDDSTSSSLIFSPMNPIYRYWRTFMMLLIAYSAVTYPFEVAFLKTSSNSLTKFYISDLIFDGCFMVDIFVTFFVGFYEPTTQLLVLDAKSIVERYLTGWFIVDFASMLPCEWVIYLVTGQHTGLIISVLTLLRLSRLRHVEQFFTRLEKDISKSYFWVRLTRLLCVVVLYIHMVGCVYFYLAITNPYQQGTWLGSINLNGSERNLFIWFVSAIYWSMTTFTTVGYGDVHPENEIEKLFSTMYMLSVLVVLGYVTANMTDLVTESSRPTKESRNSLQDTTRFVNRIRLPVRLKEQIIAYKRLSLEAQRLNQEQEIGQLPMFLQKKIRQEIFLPTIERVYLFSLVKRETLLLLVNDIKAECVLPKEDVIVMNQEPDYVYVIESGEVEIVGSDHEDKDKVFDVLRSSAMFGEVGAISCRPESYTYRTRTLTKLLRFETKTLRRAMQDDSRILQNFYKHHKSITKTSKTQKEKQGLRGAKKLK